MRIHKDELGFLSGSFVLVPQVEKFCRRRVPAIAVADEQFPGP